MESQALGKIRLHRLVVSALGSETKALLVQTWSLTMCRGKFSTVTSRLINVSVSEAVGSG